MKLRKKIISTILVVIMVMCMIPVDCVYAAGNGLIRLKQGEVCAKYDITGNGKKDTIQYSHTTRDNIKVYVNGKLNGSTILSNIIPIIQNIKRKLLSKNIFFLYIR